MQTDNSEIKKKTIKTMKGKKAFFLSFPLQLYISL